MYDFSRSPVCIVCTQTLLFQINILERMLYSLSTIVNKTNDMCANIMRLCVWVHGKGNKNLRMFSKENVQEVINFICCATGKISDNFFASKYANLDVVLQFTPVIRCAFGYFYEHWLKNMSHNLQKINSLCIQLYV